MPNPKKRAEKQEAASVELSHRFYMTQTNEHSLARVPRSRLRKLLKRIKIGVEEPRERAKPNEKRRRRPSNSERRKKRPD